MNNNHKIVLGVAIGAFAGFLIGHIIQKKKTDEYKNGFCDVGKQLNTLFETIKDEFDLPQSKIDDLKNKLETACKS